jgi:hypothetical protein
MKGKKREEKKERKHGKGRKNERNEGERERNLQRIRSQPNKTRILLVSLTGGAGGRGKGEIATGKKPGQTVFRRTRRRHSAGERG